MAANVDLIKAAYKQCYPYMNFNDYVEPKLMFLWHYKIQNILNVGLEMLLDCDLIIVEVQKLVWNDVFRLQKFLTSEITKKAGN